MRSSIRSARRDLSLVRNLELRQVPRLGHSPDRILARSRRPWWFVRLRLAQLRRGWVEVFVQECRRRVWSFPRRRLRALSPARLCLSRGRLLRLLPLRLLRPRLPCARLRPRSWFPGLVGALFPLRLVRLSLWLRLQVQL